MDNVAARPHAIRQVARERSMSAWNEDIGAGSSGLTAVTVVEGSSFCISAESGDVFPGQPQGAFYQDTRILSRWQLTVDGVALEPLSGQTREPYRAVFVGRPRGANGAVESPLVVEHSRQVGPGLRDDIRVHNYSEQSRTCRIQIKVDADLSDLFDVKGGKVVPSTEHSRQVRADALQIDAQRNGIHRGVIISASGATVTEDALTFDAELAPRGVWTASVFTTPLVDGAGPEQPFTHESAPHVGAQRYAAWEEHVPRLTVTDRNVEKVLTRSQEDLGALRIFDPEHPERAAVAAGAPWFMALFGRDSILSSYMALPVDPKLAAGTLQTLASLQGEKVDPDTEEEPGRILHEVRLGVTAGLALGGSQAYYGTADATPLFVSLLAELGRWGLAGDLLDSLLPHADRALEWVEHYGDRDGDGFVEYQRANEHGLLNQGWKDSWDGINFADGRLAEAPIALCEVQGYVYAAYLGRALLAQQLGDEETAAKWNRPGRRYQGRVQREVLAPRAGILCRRPGQGQAPGGCLHLQHGPLPLGGNRRRRKGAPRGQAADVAGDVHGLGNPDARLGHGCLQPGQLPQRFGVAARHSAGGRRADAVRVRRGGHANRHGPVRCGGTVRRAAAGTLLRILPGRFPRPRPLPHVLLAAGLGIGRAGPPDADPPALGSPASPWGGLPCPRAAGWVRQLPRGQRADGLVPDHRERHRQRRVH
jgi:hypothetical protein